MPPGRGKAFSPGFGPPVANLLPGDNQQPKMTAKLARGSEFRGTDLKGKAVMASGKVALITGAVDAELVGTWPMPWPSEAMPSPFSTAAPELRQLKRCAHMQRQGVDAAAFAADVTDEDRPRSMVKQVVSKFGRIDVLVCTAAAWQSKPLEEVTAADVRGFFEVNTLGTFLCCQQVGLSHVQAARRGLHGHVWRLGLHAALPQLRRIFSVQGSDPDADSYLGGGIGDAESAQSG